MAGRLPCPRDRVLPPPLLPSCVLKPAVKNVEQRHVAQTRVGGVSVCDVPKWVRNSRVGGRRQLTRSSRLGRREPARGGGVAGGSGGARSLPSPAQRAAGARGGKDAATGLRRALLGDRPRNKMADDKEREGTGKTAWGAAALAARRDRAANGAAGWRVTRLETAARQQTAGAACRAPAPFRAGAQPRPVPFLPGAQPRPSSLSSRRPAPRSSARPSFPGFPRGGGPGTGRPGR